MRQTSLGIEQTMIRVGPVWGGGSCSRAQGHAPTAQSRRVLDHFLSGEVGIGVKKSGSGALTVRGRVENLTRAGNPRNYAGAAGSHWGGWATKQAEDAFAAIRRAI